MSADLQGRPYAKIAKTKSGDIVEVDGDFTCIPAGAQREVKMNIGGRLFIECGCGKHFLDGQARGNHYLGVYTARVVEG